MKYDIKLSVTILFVIIPFLKSANSQHNSLYSLTNTSECYGNRAEASRIGQKCSRKCRKDLPCENTRKQCLCDGLCGLSCLKSDLTCPDLPRIENGNFSPKTTLFSTRVIYQCDSGYYLFGSEERLCQGDEDWSGTPAVCLSEPLCLNPPKVNHARNPNDGTYLLNDKVNYSCYPGYQFKGSSEATCKLVQKNQTAWEWTSTPFECIPRSCGDPGLIENGKRIGESFIIASSVLYSCNDGFDLVGQARRYCQSDNQWSGQPPHCEPITCNPTDHLDNGKINYVYPLIFNSTVEYTCDYGFRLIGPKKRTCGPERKLIGELSKCEEIDCGEIGPLYNGRIVGSSTRMGDKKEFVCNEGMTFLGNQTESVCQESGNWSNSLPQCLAPCTVPRVEQSLRIYVIPPEIMAKQSTTEPVANITLQQVEPGKIVNHGSFLEILCQNNYELDEQMDDESTIQAPMCNNQTWSYMPRCQPASCKKKPPSPKNGRVTVASIQHGSKGHIRCLDGYKLIGDEWTYCRQGSWSSINSNCSDVFCGFPGSIEHGKVLLVGFTGMYEYKPYIRKISSNRQLSYECENGYHLNDRAPNGATCIDGRWKPEGLPTCIKE